MEVGKSGPLKFSYKLDEVLIQAPPPLMMIMSPKNAHESRKRFTQSRPPIKRGWYAMGRVRLKCGSGRKREFRDWAFVVVNRFLPNKGMDRRENPTAGELAL